MFFFYSAPTRQSKPFLCARSLFLSLNLSPSGCVLLFVGREENKRTVKRAVFSPVSIKSIAQHPPPFSPIPRFDCRVTHTPTVHVFFAKEVRKKFLRKNVPPSFASQPTPHTPSPPCGAAAARGERGGPSASHRHHPFNQKAAGDAALSFTASPRSAPPAPRPAPPPCRPSPRPTPRPVTRNPTRRPIGVSNTSNNLPGVNDVGNDDFLHGKLRSSYYCGWSWDMTIKSCQASQPCPSGLSGDCPAGQT